MPWRLRKDPKGSLAAPRAPKAPKAPQAPRAPRAVSAPKPPKPPAPPGYKYYWRNTNPGAIVDGREMIQTPPGAEDSLQELHVRL